MRVEPCARIIIQAMVRRKREVVMSLEGKLGLWLYLISPGVVEYVTRKKT
jgi:hypothetical protein